MIEFDVVLADHELIEDLRAGGDPPADDETAHLLAAWRLDVIEGAW